MLAPWRCASARDEGIDKTMTDNDLDAIVAPTGGPAWPTDLVTGDHFLGGSSTAAAAAAGYPIVSVPAGDIFGLPVGISFMGSAWSEPTLLAPRLCLRAGHPATGRRRAFLPTLELP